MSKKKGKPKQAGSGRKSGYCPVTMPKQARKLMMLGAVLKDLAAFFEVGTTTIDTWVAEHPEFKEAIRAGSVVANANVAHSLYRRACGYRHRATKFLVVLNQVQAIDYTEVYPPDTKAALAWLYNRARGSWKAAPEQKQTLVPVTITLNLAGAAEPKLVTAVKRLPKLIAGKD